VTSSTRNPHTNGDESQGSDCITDEIHVTGEIHADGEIHRGPAMVRAESIKRISGRGRRRGGLEMRRR
jgi:hypothetical protein